MKTNFNYKDYLKNKKVIFECYAGSHMYGTNTEDSDTDIRGVYLSEKSIYLGLQNKDLFMEKNDNSDDIAYYDVKKFIKLVVDCNPNILELLFVPKNSSLTYQEEWDKIVDNKHLMISKKAKHSFSGYAFQQLHRIQTHKKWLDNPLPDTPPKREDYGLDTTERYITTDSIGAFNKILALHINDIYGLHPYKEELSKYMTFESEQSFMPIIQRHQPFEGDIYQQLMPNSSSNFIAELKAELKYQKDLQDWKNYHRWKEFRNPVRAKLEEKFGYDTKYALHLIRLINEAKELLTTGFITLPRPDAKLLLEVKNGLYTYDEIIQYVKDMENDFEELYKTSILPHKADINKVNEFCAELIERHINSRFCQE